MSSSLLNDSLKHLNSSSISNSSSPDSSSSLLIDPGPIYKSYTVASFLIGFLITTVSSILNAFGINLQKLDLNRINASKPNGHQRRPDCLRPVWLIGLCLYILSQVLGSTLALQYMRSEYVAPLGSASLIFNFLFARWLLGTRITRLDVLGTLVIIIGVVGVIGFGNIRQSAGIDQEANMSLSTLKGLWARPPWIIYLIGLEFTTIFVIWLAGIAFEILNERNDLGGDRINRKIRSTTADDDDEDEDGYGSRPGVMDEDDEVEIVLRNGGGRSNNRLKNQLFGESSRLNRIYTSIKSFYDSTRLNLKSLIEKWSVSRSDQTLMKLDGLLWGCGAGLLAGQTLIFAKSFVKLVTNGITHDGRGTPQDLAHPLSILILIFLVSTGVLQVWCLNRGLKVYDSTLIVPVLFATYTASGFINSLIYLHELPTYKNWVLMMIWMSITILVVGVCMLSSKRSDPVKSNNDNNSNGNDPENNDDNDPKGLGSTREIRNYSSSLDREGEIQATANGNGLMDRSRSISISNRLKRSSIRDSSRRSNPNRKYSNLEDDDVLRDEMGKDRSENVMSLRELKDHLQDSIKMIPQRRLIDEDYDENEDDEDYEMRKGGGSSNSNSSNGNSSNRSIRTIEVLKEEKKEGGDESYRNPFEEFELNDDVDQRI